MVPSRNLLCCLSPIRYTRGMGTRSLDVGDTQRALMATISAEMDERGISIRALASDLGISHTRLAYVLRNERAVTYDEVAAMCSLLGLSLWRLLRQIEIEQDGGPSGAVASAVGAPLEWEVAAQDVPGEADEEDAALADAGA